MTLDQAHKIILSYKNTAGDDDWQEAIARIKSARQDAAFEDAYAEDGTVSRGHAKYYFDKGIEYALSLIHI
jgi:hypothetical protein